MESSDDEGSVLSSTTPRTASAPNTQPPNPMASVSRTSPHHAGGPSKGSSGPHRPRPPPKTNSPAGPSDARISPEGGSAPDPSSSGAPTSSRPSTSSARPLPKAPLSARSRFNLASASRRDDIVYGSERPGYVHPSPDQPSTPRGPLVPTPVVIQWCEEMKSKGIKRVLILLNENELSFYNEPLPQTFAKYFAEVVTLPQNSSATLHLVLDALRDACDSNEPIVVHCSTGQGRTGTILALWLHHRYSLPIPAAVTECMEFAASAGAIRKPSIEAIMQLLLGSAQRILPHIRNLQPERENGGMRGQTPRGMSSTSLNGTPSATPRLDAKLHITFVQTGGTIDKDYPKSVGGFGFEIGQPASERVLANVECAFTYDMTSVCRKDSQHVTDADRAALVACIEKSESMRFIVTHGTDTLIETAKYLDRASLSPGKVVIVTGARRPEYFRDSDAHFNVGVAVGAVNVLWSGVYVCMNGRVVEASRASRDSRTGMFALK